MWLVSKQFLPFFFLDNKDHPRIREGKSFYQFWNECSPFFSFPQPSFFIRVKFWNSVLFHFSFLWFPRDFVSFIFLFSLFFFIKKLGLFFHICNSFLSCPFPPFFLIFSSFGNLSWKIAQLILEWGKYWFFFFAWIVRVVAIKSKWFWLTFWLS